MKAGTVTPTNPSSPPVTDRHLKAIAQTNIEKARVNIAK
jgi:hypothetical protein